MAGAEEAVDLDDAAGQQGEHGGDDEFVGGQDGEVGHGVAVGADEDVGGRGRGGLEAHGGEDDLGMGLGPGEFEGVHGGGHDADGCAQGAGLLEAAAFAGDADHVAVGGDGDLAGQGEVDDGVDVGLAGHADGAAGPADEFDLVADEGAQAAAAGGDGVGTADLHDADEAANAVGGGLQAASEVVQFCSGPVVTDAM